MCSLTSPSSLAICRKAFGGDACSNKFFGFFGTFAFSSTHAGSASSGKIYLRSPCGSFQDRMGIMEGNIVESNCFQY